MLNRDIVLRKLSEMVSSDTELSNYRFGIAGSVSRGDNTENSDIDIVVDSDGMPLNLIERVRGFFTQDVDVLFLKLLKQEDDELDAFLKEQDLPINEDSVYKTVLREVVWIE